jgi:MFS family permease
VWKAIWWGLAGIPLGFVLGGMVGAVAATVIVAVAGAMNWRWHMCEAKPRGVSLRAYAAAAGVTVTVVAVHAALPFLVPLTIAAVVLAVASVPGMRWLARRTMVPRTSAAYARQPHVIRRAERAAARERARRSRLALPAPPLAIEAPKPPAETVPRLRVVPGVVVRDGETIRR